MLRLRGTWMRGGTSKCWLFDAAEFEAAERAAGADRDTLLLAAFGAADPRQIDGVGGATSTTSKAAVVRPGREAGVDVEYGFAQVGIGAERVEWGSNCGNCATAIGLYALLSGAVPVRGERTTVTLRNLNTGALLATTVPTPHGAVPDAGTATVPGVRVGGVPVVLSFAQPAGTSTGRLLPTGNAVDEVSVPYGGGTLRAPGTLVDAGAPAALLDAAALGRDPAGPLADLEAALAELTLLRRAAALAMGLATPADPVSHAVPKVGVVGPPADYRTTDGRPVPADAYDVAVRMVSMHAPHPSIGLTSAVAVAAAATVPGSTVAGALSAAGRTVPGPGAGRLRIGTPAGVVSARTEVAPDGTLRAVGLDRAARRIAVAEVFLPLPRPAHAGAAHGSADGHAPRPAPAPAAAATAR